MNKHQGSRFEVRGSRRERWFARAHFLAPRTSHLAAGFTLVETLLAVSLLAIAITAPMVLTMQALTSAYYARDQITASHLAQEGLEAVHAVRDQQILRIATKMKDDADDVDLFGALHTYAQNGKKFTIDVSDRDDIAECDVGGCDALRTNDDLYGYDLDWKPTNFTRTMTVCYVQPSGVCGTVESDEVKVTVEMSWHTGSYNVRTFTIEENLYRWVPGGAAYES
ncbi:MAG TPA: hypothetical protein VI483_02455 [Candidatus Paceibacterota bacterium]